jgi:hypothetical protein
MALIHGEKGKFPCPICLVRKDQQSDLTTTHKLCIAEDACEICEHGLTLLAAMHEELLQSYGMQNVAVSTVVCRVDDIVDLLACQEHFLDSPVF